MNRLSEMVARSVPFSAQIARALSAASFTSSDAGCQLGGACAGTMLLSWTKATEGQTSKLRNQKSSSCKSKQPCDQ